jgi:hypothetical protein
MLTLTRQDLLDLTGEQLLQMIQNQARRQDGDLQIGDQVWQVYRSTERRKGVFLNLWRSVPNGNRIPSTVHIRGPIGQRIAEMNEVG